MLSAITQWVLELFWLSMYIAVPGLILYATNEAWYRNFGRHTRRIELTTGLLGVPVHEISHAIMAKVFGMSIDEMALYKPDPQSNTLGYVNYRYRKGSIWHGVGRFFVGIAPLIGGALLVQTLFWATGLPLLHEYLYQSGGDLTNGFITWAKDLATSIQAPMQIAALIAAIMVGTHATPSKADMRGSASGLISLVFFYVAFRFICTILPGIADQWILPYVNLTDWAFGLAGMITQMAVLAAPLSILLSMIGPLASRIKFGATTSKTP